jgi:hypothetical protein
MNTDHGFFRFLDFGTIRRAAALAAAIGLGSVSAVAGSGQLDVTVVYAGPQTGPLKIMISTSPVASPDEISAKVVASTRIAAPNYGGPGQQYNFTGLPGGSYYVFAFQENGSEDGFPGGVEPMAGKGPFPYKQGAGDSGASISVPDPGTVTSTITLFNRAAIQGSVTNNTSQSGDLIVRATLDPAFYDPNYVRWEKIPAMAGGPFTLSGLLPAATPYFVEAFVDKDSDRFPQVPFEAISSSGPFNPVAMSTITSVSVTLSTTSGGCGGAAAENIRMTDSFGNYFKTLSSGIASGDLRVSVLDRDGFVTCTGSSITLTFTVWDTSNWAAPLSPSEFSLSSAPFIASFTTLGIASGAAESPVFRFKSQRTGRLQMQVRASDFPQAGQDRHAYFDFDVLSATAGFTNVGLRTDSQASYAGLTSVTITPDNDGVDEAAVMRCTPPDGRDWEIWVATSATRTPESVIRKFFGFGAGEVFWHGDDDSYRRVPNGTYFVRIQTPGGGIKDDTLSIVVNSAFIKGRVKNAAGAMLADVKVNVYGPNSGGFAVTDSTGFFFVGGLRAGQSYNVNLGKPGYVSQQSQQTASVDMGTLTLAQGATLRVLATRAMDGGEDPEVWGHVDVHTADYSQQTFGSIHFPYESSQSDNGYWTGDPFYSTYTEVGVPPSTALVVDLYLHNYGRFRTNVTSPASGAMDVSFASTTIVRKANATGRVELSSAPANYGEWISVQGRKAGDPYPSVYGGGYIDVGQTTATYHLFGLDPGTWTFLAYARDHRSQSTSTYVGGSDVTVNFPAFVPGGGFSGAITVTGDTSGLSLGGAMADKFQVFVNAHSRTTFQGGYARVYLTTNTVSTSGSYALRGLDDGTYNVYTFLEGFQLNPPGPKQVTVSGESGTLNLAFEALSGRINLSASIPTGDDPIKVTYNVEGDGPGGRIERKGAFPSGSLVNGVMVATACITNLGTGLYRVSVQNMNPGRGLLKNVGVAVTNGVDANVALDLRDNTYGISGTISVQGNVVLPSTWSVTVSSAAGLRVWAPPAPMIQVFAFPLPDHFHGEVPPLQVVQATVNAGASTGTYQVTGLPSGTYLVRVQEDLNPPRNASGPPQSGLPEFATTNRVVHIQGASQTGVDLTITNGVEVSGTISRPDGDTSTDSRSFRLFLRREDNLTVLQATVATSGAGTASYQFQHLAEGNYVLEIREENWGGSSIPKYVAEPKRIAVGRSNVTQNVALMKAGTIVGKLRDADSNTLITSQNKSNFLPERFQVFAHANPWVPGGYAQAEADYSESRGSLIISSATGQFTLYRLLPGLTYDVNFRGFQGLNDQAVSKGQKAYSPVVKSGIKIAEGQTLDLGTIDLTQGVAIKGRITDKAGAVLPNVRVVAYPSLSEGGDRHELGIEGFTNAEGKYMLAGADRNRKYYDVIAAPRFDHGDVFANLSGKKYGEEKLRSVDISDPAKRENVDFRLTEANGVLTGKIETVDNGPLEEPFDSRGGFTERRARIFLHLDGTVTDDPLGEIEAATDSQGNFRIDALKPGSYGLRAVSLGYVTARKNVTVAAGANSAGTITLQKGATVKGTITKPDGSAPSTNEIHMVVGVDDDFKEFVFGSIESNPDTDMVTGYKLTGFKPNLSYSIVVGTENDDILQLKTGLTFSSASDEKTVNLVFRPAPPAVFATQSRSGNVVSLRFFSTHKLRNLTEDDNDLSQIITLAAGNGVIVSSAIASSRDTLSVDYQAPANESSFKIRVAFTSAQTDPDSATGDNFSFDETFEFFAGVGRSRRVKIANATGGSAVLEGDPSGLTCPSGTFQVDSSSRVEVGVLSAVNVEDLTGAPRAAGPQARAQGALAAARKLGPAAYPVASLYKAVQTAPSISPFSAFYDIFLPAGVSHSLKKEALLTLKYDDSVEDPSTLNIYYFDEGNNVYLLESTKRVVDESNKTITVAVNHASTFVVLRGNAPVIGANNYTGQDILLYNFPNPFDLKTKTVSLNNAPSSPTQTIEGTLIKYALPAGKSGRVRIEIYNVAGERVRALAEDAPTGGTYYYTTWDGKNDAGRKVASGVYIARFTLNDGDEKFLKMAVIK